MNSRPGISVVIPTLNEGPHIGGLLSYLSSFNPSLELIVSDGGSVDNTIEIASDFAQVTRASQGRATQMNAGAALASGRVLWFLHADCHPHEDSIIQIEEALTDPVVVGGGFEYTFDDPRTFFRLAECCSNAKNRALGLLYGDMGIFVKRDIFISIGGYQDILLMEDMEICRRLKKAGKIVIIPRTMRTSARRWRDQGIITTVLMNWGLQIAWKAGVAPSTLHKVYYGKS